MTTNVTDSTTQKQKSRTLLEYLGLTARGFAMGAADVVPGVSGGTMAFILGIYEELIDSIRDLLNPSLLKAGLRFDIKQVLALTPWKFLLAVGAGILIAIFSLAQFLETALVNYPVLVWSFFFGLVFASIFTVIKRIQVWSSATIASLAVGTVLAYIIVGLVPTQTPETNWFLFFSGFIAICAMILPGISGSFILVLLGKYQYILAAVNSRDIVTLLVVAMGAGIGLLTFAQFLGWLFKRYHDVTVALLTGLMIGSLRKIWPWKETLRTILDRHGEEIPVEQINVLPAAWTPEVTVAIVLAIVGFILVLALDRWANLQTQQATA